MKNLPSFRGQRKVGTACLLTRQSTDTRVRRHDDARLMGIIAGPGPVTIQLLCLVLHSLCSFETSSRKAGTQ